MAGGKTLIGGTTYSIKGGKTLIDGTAYSIKGGKTLIGGTTYAVKFGTPVTVKLMGQGAESRCIEINGEKHWEAGSYSANIGDKVKFAVSGYGTGYMGVSLNGTWVFGRQGYGGQSTPAEYEITLTGDMQIQIEYDTSTGRYYHDWYVTM